MTPSSFNPPLDFVYNAWGCFPYNFTLTFYGNRFEDGLLYRLPVLRRLVPLRNFYHTLLARRNPLI